MHVFGSESYRQCQSCWHAPQAPPVASSVASSRECASCRTACHRSALFRAATCFSSPRSVAAATAVLAAVMLSAERCAEGASPYRQQGVGVPRSQECWGSLSRSNAARRGVLRRGVLLDCRIPGRGHKHWIWGRSDMQPGVQDSCAHLQRIVTLQE